MISVFCFHPDNFIAAEMARILNNAPGFAAQAIPVAKGQKAVIWAINSAPPPPDTPHPVFLQKGPMRLKAIMRALRATAALHDAPRRLVFGACHLDTATRDFAAPHGLFSLTEKEAAILAYLHDNSTATRDDLLRDVWRYAADADTHTVETHIYRLRRKIEQNPDDPAIVVTTDDGYALGYDAAVSSA
jgi:hypothetical protein